MQTGRDRRIIVSIPKILYQTYKSYKAIPLVTRAAMRLERLRCPDYEYEFYDDERIEDFLKDEYGAETLSAYRRINVGAAKADFFRYAVLYRRGGVYLDVDSEDFGKAGWPPRAGRRRDHRSRGESRSVRAMGACIREGASLPRADDRERAGEYQGESIPLRCSSDDRADRLLGIHTRVPRQGPLDSP